MDWISEGVFGKHIDAQYSINPYATQHLFFVRAG